MKKIYLAGPITGCNWGESEDWRDSFKKLDLPGIQGFSPLRGKEYLKSETTIADNYSNTVMSSAKAIMTRDSFDVFSADAIFSAAGQLPGSEAGQHRDSDGDRLGVAASQAGHRDR